MEMSEKIVDYRKYITNNGSVPAQPAELENTRLSVVNEVLSTGKPKVPSANAIWDSLRADKPLYNYIPAGIVDDLRRLSLTNVGNNEKVSKMRSILASIGMYPIGVGTNRAAFQSIHSPNYVFKIALDEVGRKDSPREFLNQEFLKPFCTKIYEVTPCGSVAMVEAVFPIKTKADFKLFFQMIVHGFLVPFIGGRFAMDDIGFENFMNYGIREEFGPVLLDFPYLYAYDTDKMRCSNVMYDGTICNGQIDYEVGFMDFVCPNCGERFRAKDIGRPLYDIDNIIQNNLQRLREKGIISADNRLNDITPRKQGIEVVVKKNGEVIADNRKKNKINLSDIRTVSYQKK